MDAFPISTLPRRTVIDDVVLPLSSRFHRQRHPVSNIHDSDRKKGKRACQINSFSHLSHRSLISQFFEGLETSNRIKTSCGLLPQSKRASQKGLKTWQWCMVTRCATVRSLEVERGKSRCRSLFRFVAHSHRCDVDELGRRDMWL